jgi:protease-4
MTEAQGPGRPGAAIPTGSRAEAAGGRTVPGAAALRAGGRMRAWLAAAALGAALAGCTGFAGYNPPQFKEVLLQGTGSDKILLIDINGPISNQPLLIQNVGIIPGMTARVRQELELAFNDNSIRGVLLRIDSPGGTITDSDVIYHSLMEFKKAKKVKVIAAMGDIAASGALYIAMAADEIYAHPTTVTGSIGVIMDHMDVADLMNKLGVRSDPVTSGKYKDISSQFRKMTDEERTLLQAVVSAQYEHFIKVVQDGRPKMTQQQIRSIADGRIFTADEAKERGLIDGIGYLDDVYKRISQLAGFPTNRLVRYSNTWLTGNNIYSSSFPIEFIQN